VQLKMLSFAIGRTLAVATFCTTVTVAGNAQQPVSGYSAPRTAWGDPDLTGKWPGTDMVGVPMQREERFGTRNVLTDEEFVERQNRAVQQEELDNADFELENAASTPGGDVGGAVSPPPHWLERGQPQRQASLIVDPPNGRMPPFTQQAQERQAALREYRASRGPADSYTDRSNYDRCISNGILNSVTPKIYNSGNRIVQGPGWLAFSNEMIHETRVIPTDGRKNVGSGFKGWMGNSVGRWEGDVLVVETRNLDPKSLVSGAVLSDEGVIIERFTLADANTLDYRRTVVDPKNFTAPWTMRMPIPREDDYGFHEYACHEGNYSMINILSGSRAEEKRRAEALARGEKLPEPAAAPAGRGGGRGGAGGGRGGGRGN
jgi:hypothetical protein